MIDDSLVHSQQWYDVNSDVSMIVQMIYSTETYSPCQTIV